MGNSNKMNQVLPPVLCPLNLQQNNEPTPNICTTGVDGNKLAQKTFSKIYVEFPYNIQYVLS